jgi:hypothetical protein
MNIGGIFLRRRDHFDQRLQVPAAAGDTNFSAIFCAAGPSRPRRASVHEK